MAFPTVVNPQITDSVTQANVKVLGEAPAIAMDNLYQATAQALANAAHNATMGQSTGTTPLPNVIDVNALNTLDADANLGPTLKSILES